MDYESNTNNAHEEEYLINLESNFPFSPNSKDYDSSTEEGEDEEYPPSQYLKAHLIIVWITLVIMMMEMLIKMIIQ